MSNKETFEVRLKLTKESLFVPDPRAMGEAMRKSELLWAHKLQHHQAVLGRIIQQCFVELLKHPEQWVPTSLAIEGGDHLRVEFGMSLTELQALSYEADVDRSLKILNAANELKALMNSDD